MDRAKARDLSKEAEQITPYPKGNKSLERTHNLQATDVAAEQDDAHILACA